MQRRKIKKRYRNNEIKKRKIKIEKRGLIVRPTQEHQIYIFNIFDV